MALFRELASPKVRACDGQLIYVCTGVVIITIR
jgi:hypothetical protein